MMSKQRSSKVYRMVTVWSSGKPHESPTDCADAACYLNAGDEHW